MIEFKAKPDKEGIVSNGMLEQWAGKDVVFFAMEEKSRSTQSLNFYRGIWLRLITKELITAGYHREDLIITEEGVLDKEFVHKYFKQRAKIDSVKKELPQYKMESYMKFVERICQDDFNIKLPDPKNNVINFLKQ